jgi:hypothetical protein
MTEPIGEYPDFTPKQLQQIIQYYWETLRYNYTNAMDDLYDKIILQPAKENK